MGSVKSFRRRSRSITVKKNVPPGIKARQHCGMILVSKGWMRFAFPPYGA
jgi:hypothetical protein